MVRRPQAQSRARVDPVSNNGAGQDGDWLRRGKSVRNALAETWGAMAEVCFELSEAEWALPTECPGWDVKDQFSHLIGIERAIMGEPVPEWDAAPRCARQERVRGHQRALRRRATGPARIGRAGGIRRGHRDAPGPVGRPDGGGLGRTGMEPRRRGASRGVHDRPRLRQLGARTRCPARPRSSWRRRERGVGHLARPRPGRHALRRGQAGRLLRRHRRALPGGGARGRRTRLHGCRGGWARPSGGQRCCARP